MTDVACYIEFRCNNKSLHSGLGYKTLKEIYAEHLDRQFAA